METLSGKKIMIMGGDGFCGWPTALRVANVGAKVLIVDNLSRRMIDERLGIKSLTPIAPVEDRVSVANDMVGDISFEFVDIATDPARLRQCISDFAPHAVVHFAEQRAAPYSMVDDERRRYTVDNNTSGTHNILSAIVDINPEIKLIHLGTMGVYGYSKEFGKIPEGYLNIKINATGNDVDVLYPQNPGSIYHLTKCLDQLLFQFYNKNWGLSITDLHQGIVWGTQTELTRLHGSLTNRFDYDGMYGTVLNRFLSQAASGNSLTVYGVGGQSRAFIHVEDTARCVMLAVENALVGDEPFNRVRIYNQVAEVKSVKQLAEMVAEMYSVEVSEIENPRKELAVNELEVQNDGLRSLGFEPILLSDGLVDDVKTLASSFSTRINPSKILNSPKW